MRALDLTIDPDETPADTERPSAPSYTTGEQLYARWLDHRTHAARHMVFNPVAWSRLYLAEREAWEELARDLNNLGVD